MVDQSAERCGGSTRLRGGSALRSRRDRARCNDRNHIRTVHRSKRLRSHLAAARPPNLRVFILADSPRTPLLLLCYDMQSFAMTSVTALDADIGGYPLNMTLWGTNGIAFEYGENTVAVLAGAFR